MKFVRAHFEAIFYGYFWANACVLALLVGRPRLGALGFLTVLPFLGAYFVRSRRRKTGSSPPPEGERESGRGERRNRGRGG